MNKKAILFLRQTENSVLSGGADIVVLETVKNMLKSEYYFPIPVFISNLNTISSDLSKEKNGVYYEHLLGKRLIDFKLIDTLEKIIKKNNIIIIHSNDYKSNLIALILKFKIPYLKNVSTAHGYISNKMKTRLYNKFDRCMLRFFDKIIIVNKKMRALFSDQIQSKIMVVYNGVDELYWSKQNSRKNDVVVVGFAGRISPEKGWKEFIELVDRIGNCNVKINFKIAGDGPDFRDMMERIKKLTSINNVEVLGHVKNMKFFYENVDILCAPSHTEGFPIVQLEANSMSIPVVATDVGGVSELIIDGFNGFLVKNKDSEMLYKKVKELASDKKLLTQMGNNGRDLVIQRFSIKENISLIHNVYDSLT